MRISKEKTYNYGNRSSCDKELMDGEDREDMSLSQISQCMQSLTSNQSPAPTESPESPIQLGANTILTQLALNQIDNASRCQSRQSGKSLFPQCLSNMDASDRVRKKNIAIHLIDCAINYLIISGSNIWNLGGSKFIACRQRLAPPTWAGKLYTRTR